MGEYQLAALYGFVLLTVLQTFLAICQTENPRWSAALRKDWKGKASVALYVVGIGLSFVVTWLSIATCLVVADRRFKDATRAQE